MPGQRVAFTGGSGKVGRHVIRELLKHGHSVINLDLHELPDADLAEAVHTVKCDVTDSGQVFSCLNTHMRLGEPWPAGESPSVPDAVVHFAGINKPMIVSDGETFRVNVMGTHNVIEAACKLGVKKVILASSVTVYGVSFAQGNVAYPSFPVMEDDADRCNPTDPYALSKLCGERVARSYAGRYRYRSESNGGGVDIYCLRIGRVFEPNEYDSDMFWGYVHEPEKWFQHGWSYTDARDLGQMCHRALEVNGLGFQVFNAVNDTVTTADTSGSSSSTEELLRRLQPDTPHVRPLVGNEAPIGNEKMRRLLGFKEEHTWTKYFTRW